MRGATPPLALKTPLGPVIRAVFFVLFLTQGSSGAVANERSEAIRSVGMLVAPNFLCTASLIAPNQILTSRHCVPETGVSEIKVVFSGSETEPAVSATGKKLILASPELKNPWAPDYAVIELNKKIPRPALRLAASPERTLTTVTAIVNSPTVNSDDMPVPEIKTLDCETVEKSILVSSENFGITHYPLSGCPIEHGNSGGPILNTNAEIIGIIQIQTSAFELINLNKGLRRHLLDSIDTLKASNLSLATSVFCITNPNDSACVNEELPDFKKNITSHLEAMQSPRMKAQLRLVLAEAINTWKANSAIADQFHWQVDLGIEDDDALVTTHLPASNRKFGAFSAQAIPVCRLSNQTESPTETPQWLIEIGLNASMGVDLRVTQGPFSTTFYQPIPPLPFCKK